MPRVIEDRAPNVAPRGKLFVVVAAGLIAFAVAQGIGRFAFTPILPMMQADVGLTLKAAGWLAAANYLGYFLGALFAARVPRIWALRGGLLLIAIVTAAMGFTHFFALRLVLRLVAGVASAWIVVHIAAWALSRLATMRRAKTNGVVFAGVGIGIAGAGLLCLLFMHLHTGSNRAWEWLGLAALVLTAAIWTVFRDDTSAHGNAPATRPRQRMKWNRDRLRLALCYGAFGFGYIIPATYLPTMAQHYIHDPLVFGWAWPVFGAAAAVSTWMVARWLHRANNRRLWAGASLIMAIGVALPVAWPSLAAILVAALLVGGTMMVITMSGLREARLVSDGEATALMAAITAVFALGQIIGPLVVSALVPLRYGFQGALIAAALLLALASITLWRSARLTSHQRQL
jgi:predicted MFS family arabinose efflux permease